MFAQKKSDLFPHAQQTVRVLNLFDANKFPLSFIFQHKVLDRIFPRNPKNKEDAKPGLKPRRASMLETYSYVGRRSSMSPSQPTMSSKLMPREQRESSSSPSHRSSRQIPNRFAPGLPGFGVSSRGAMEEFRTKLLEKFTTIKEAFETFMKDLPERSLDRTC